MPVNPRHSGTAFSIFFGGFHLLWTVLVAVGAAQTFADFVSSTHFIAPTLRVLPFQLSRALGLVAVTTATGFFFGWVFGHIWNWVGKQK